MTSKEFIDLVRKMREKQEEFINCSSWGFKSIRLFREAKALEIQVDEADIDDIANLVTDSPIR